MGIRRIWDGLDYNSKSRTIAELRDKLHLSEMRVDFLENIVKDQKEEIKTQKHGNEQMWRFIHRSRRLDVPDVAGSIREILKRRQ